MTHSLARVTSRLSRSFTFVRKQRDVRRHLHPVGAERLESRVLLSAQLVKDLIAGPEGGQPMDLTAAGERLIFSTGGSQPGLWVSDGTDAGTARISDARISPDAYEGRSTTALGADGLFFNGPGGLWKTDGTPAGTAQVKALDPFTSGQVLGLTTSGGILYFTTVDTWYGEELWRSDGTPDGTVMVKDINPSQAYNYNARGSHPRNLIDVNGTLFFTASAPGTGGEELWKSDGTAEGTVLVKDINPSNTSVVPFQLTNVNGRLFFAGDDGSHGYELWTSDGTAAGTRLVKDIFTGPQRSLYEQGSMAALGDVLLFTARATDTSIGLWRSDGTADGTYRIAALAPTSGGSFQMPGQLTRVGDSTAYFTSKSASELWKTDGTAAGTVRVKTFPVNTLQGITSLTDGGGKLFFRVNDGTSGYELWTSDGTEAGTVRVDDIAPGAASSWPSDLTEVNGNLFFSAADGSHGEELWKLELPAAAPAAPSSLSATPLSGGEIALAWADNADDEAGFILERSGTPEFAPLAASVKLMPGTVRYLDTGVDAGATYYYRLRAFNRAGSSPPVTASAATPASPAAPTAFSATAASHARVDLAWADNSSNETGFRIERSPVSTFSIIDATYDVGPDVRTFADTAVAPETHYFYRVSAVGPAGRSAAPRAHAGTPGRPPSALEGWGVSGNQIDLQWTNPQGGGPYALVLERALPGEDFADLSPLSSGSTSYADGYRRPNTAYRYRVRAVGPFGRTVPSNEVSVTTPPPVLATLVKDLNTADTPAGSSPSRVVTLNGIGYFAASDETHGTELWRTDGTAAGTWRVVDLMPGPNGDVGVYPGSEATMGPGMAVLNGALYFRANDGSHGSELWKTDGTEPGTVLVGDTVPGAEGIGPAWLTEVNGTLFFTAGDGELWKTDGTAAGIVRVKDIRPGPDPSSPSNLVAWNGVLYFAAADGTGGRPLWRSDGTEAGTYRVSEIAAGSMGISDPQSFTPAGDALYFSAFNLNTGRELWKTDGTLAGTVLVKDANPGPQWSDPQNLFADGNSLLFVAGDATTGKELWRSDGTEAGTGLVADLLPGSMDSSPFAFTRFKGKTYFLAMREGASYSLYETDGTSAGTKLVKELPGGSFDAPTNMIVLGDSLYLVAVRPEESGGGLGLWKSDGTEAGTTAVSEPFTWFPRGGSFSSLGNTLLFPAAESMIGDGGELWRSDGTAAGTYQLKNIRVLNGSSSPSNLTAMGNHVYFTTAADSGVAAGLWRSDGTDAGTVLLHAGDASRLAAAGDTLYFVSSDENGQELWKSDGTPAGTVPLKDVTPGPAGSVISHPRATADGHLFFLARPAAGSDNDYRLWRSDGTEAGTAQVSDVAVVYNEFDTFRKPRPAVVGNTIYFAGSLAGVSSPGAELWKSDGTPGGTVRVKNMGSTGGGDSSLLELAAAGQTVYFVAWTSQFKHALWKTDGTEAGTVLVSDVYDGTSNPPISNLTGVGDTLYFAADGQGAGFELWKTDGSAAGTVRVVELNPGPASAAPAHLTAVGNTLYFAGTDPANGRSLWKSDGTAAGTTRVRAVADSGGSSPFYLFDANGTLFYSDGGALWRSDGTRTGTFQVLRVADSGTEAGVLGSPVAVAGDTLFVRGFDPAHGRELWSVSTILPAAPSEPAAVALGGGQVRVTWRDNSSTETGFLVERLAGAANGLLAAENGGVVDRTFFVDSNDTDFVDSPPAGAGAYRYRVRAVNAAGQSAPTAEVAPAPAVPAVVGWNAFYNNSAFDGNDAGAGAADDAAIDPGKRPLLPGQAPSPANFTNYTRGINGVMIDVSGGMPLTALAAMAAGIRLRMGNGGDPANWPDAPRPTLVAIRPGAGAGGSDRVTLVWPDGAIKNTWLQFTVPAQPQSGLDHDLVYYFGNLAGDTGDSAATFRVNALDLSAVKRALNTNSIVTGRFDFNRDGRVNALDLSAARGNLNRSLAAAPAGAAQPQSSPAVAAARPASGLAPASIRSAWEDAPTDPLGRPAGLI